MSDNVQPVQTTIAPEITTETSPVLDSAYAKVKEDLRNRIIHCLTVYPFITNSMLHIGIGTSQTTNLWKPILEELKSEGLVKETNILVTSPQGRAITASILHLTTNEYTYGPPADEAA